MVTFGEQLKQEGISQGISQGITQGISQGEMNEKIKVVLNAFENELPISTIAKITKLSEEEVISILKDNNRI